MEILINGKSPAGFSLSDKTSFSKIMTELNLQIAEREEIVTDVLVNGKELANWDRADVDVSTITQIDIVTLPTRDYAIASLGELGDYTANMLAVIRNARAICDREGFVSVKARLREGLDYIQVVIDMSCKVLDLRLDQARYDMRTGDQMIQGLRALKGQLSQAADFNSSEKLFEELDFTLTDWLKFLEILLRRYGERQDLVGSSDDVRDDIGAQVQIIDQLHQDIQSIVQDLYAGKITKSLDQFQSRVQVLQEALLYLQKLQAAGRFRYDALSADGEPLIDKIQKFPAALNELSESLRIGDTVLMRDILEYEILPFLTYLRQIFGQISSQQSKD